MDFLGYIGTFSFLVLYFMSGLTKRWDLDDWQYHFSIFFGSVALFFYALYLNSIPFMILEIVGIAMVAMWFKQEWIRRNTQ